MNENIGHQSMLPLTYLAKADLEHGIHLLMQMAEERLQDLQYAPIAIQLPTIANFAGVNTATFATKPATCWQQLPIYGICTAISNLLDRKQIKQHPIIESSNPHHPIRRRSHA